MQNHFMMRTISTTQRFTEQRLAIDSHDGSMNQREVVVIDLTSLEQTASFEKRRQQMEEIENARNRQIQEALHEFEELTRQKSKGIEKKKNFKGKTPAFKKCKSSLKEGSNGSWTRSSFEEVREVVEMEGEFQEAIQVEKEEMPQKLNRQVTIYEFVNKLALEQAEKSNKHLEKNPLRGSLNGPVENAPEIQEGRVSVENKLPIMKILSSMKEEETDLKKDRRLTRNQLRKDNSLEVYFYSNFEDELVRACFQAAKYRFNFPEVTQTLDGLTAKISDKVHYGQKRAVVLPLPAIELNSFKHRILVECLKIQLRKRSFILVE